LASSVLVRFSGRVQGVGFRYFTRKKARELNLKGYVKNLPDGKVEILIIGGEARSDRLIETCKKGPRMAFVNDIEIKRDINVKKKYDDFIIER